MHEGWQLCYNKLDVQLQLPRPGALLSFFSSAANMAMPALSEKQTRQINLNVLKRVDPDTEEVSGLLPLF